MKRTHLLAISGLCVAGVMALWLVSRPSAPAQPELPAASGETASGGEPAPTMPRPPRPTLGDRERPEATAGGAASATGDDTGGLGSVGDRERGSIDDSDAAVAGARQPRSYVRADGVLVRDYRKDPDRAAPSGPLRRPGVIGKVAPSTIVAVRNAVRPVVLTCLADADDRTFAAEPRLQLEVVVTISGGWLTAEEVNVQLADVGEPTASAMSTCVSDGVAALTLDAQGHDDITAYPLTLPFRLRR